MSLLLGRAVIETLKVTVPTTVEGMWGASRATCSRRIDSWSRNLVEAAEVRIETQGLENLGTDETFVVMSNHQSLYDVPVLYQALQVQMRMVAKKELFRIPFFGQAMAAAEFVKVDRGNRRKAFEAIDRAKELMESGLSIWIAPEGTRSKDGALGEFKRGGFHLALGTGARILPVTVWGTMHVMPTKSLSIHRGKRVHVHVSPPINPADFGRKRLPELVDAVRAAIASNLPINGSRVL